MVPVGIPRRPSGCEERRNKAAMSALPPKADIRHPKPRPKKARNAERRYGPMVSTGGILWKTRPNLSRRPLADFSGLEKDVATGSRHTIYSLRHTAICMRIILSEGRVNIFNLAKNAGTSVDQIERFYARNLPLSKEMAIFRVSALSELGAFLHSSF
jgi:hypothetical protein